MRRLLFEEHFYLNIYKFVFFVIMEERHFGSRTNYILLMIC